MFNKKPRRNFRQRKQTSSDEEEKQRDSGDGEDTEKDKAGGNKPSKLSQGRGISCSSKREPTSPKPDSSDGEDSETVELTEEIEVGDKDKHGVKKKKDNVLSFSDDKEAEEPAFKVKKSADKAVLFQVRKKEASPVKTSRRTAPAAGRVPPSASPRSDSEIDSVASPVSLPLDDDEDEDDDDDEEGDDYDNKYELGATSPSASSASDTSRSATKPVVVHSAKEIRAARRQRHAKRTQKEFISLSRDGHSSAGSTPDRYSREDEDDRVDDDDDEPDDHERRIQFAPRLKSIRERIAEKLGASDGSLSGTDGEEQDLWEETQIGKGVRRHPGEQSPSGSESSSYSNTSSSRRGRRNQRKRPLGVPKTLPAVSVSMVKKRINGKLESLKEVYRARQAELRRMEGDIDSAKTSVESLEESPSESRLKFYRTMNLYVHNLVECLREKVVEINSLELEMHTLLSDQMEALTAQRQQRVKEQADRLQQLSYNKDDRSEGSANGTQTQRMEDSNTKAEDPLNIPEDTQPSEEYEQQLQKKKAEIMLKSQAVFSDVQDEFSNVKKILSRFEEWRGCYSESYHNAYISLCLPKLLNPIIRHQLLLWNPLKDDSGDFENLPWFSAVETFCHGHGHEELENEDRQTLSNVIEKTVLPKITAYAELLWDPMSSQQSVCLSDLCHRLKEDYSIFEGEQTKPVRAFLEAVMRRLRSCVDEDVFIPLYPKNLLEDSSSPHRHFRDQQFVTAIKLLGNMGKFDLLLPESVLKELMLDKLLNRYLMITLSSQTLYSNAVDACRMIADRLPPSWLKGLDVCLPQLQNFKNSLVQNVHTLCKQQPPEDPNTRSSVLEVLQVLSKIRCNDSIMALAEKYHYEDLIYSHQLLNQDAV